MKSRRAARSTWLIVVSFAILVAAVLAIAFGVLDRFVSGGLNKRAVIGSLVVYWFMFFTIGWLIPAAMRRRKETLLAIVSFVFTLAMAEIACRLLIPGASAIKFDFGGVSSPLFHHIYPAHTRMFMARSEGKDVFMDTNEDGLRTEYSKEAFKKYRHRVVVLGDSFVLGVGITPEDSLVKRLEANLRQAVGDESVAVINAGILSYSPFLEKLLFERKMADYQPTLVLVVLDASDIGDDYLYMKEATQTNGTTTFPLEDGAPPKYWGALFEIARPYIYEFGSALSYPFQLARTLTGGQGGPAKSYNYYDFAVTVDGTVERNRFFIYRHPLSATRPFFDATMRNVDEVSSLAAGRGAGFAFFVAPRYQHWNVKECPDNWEKRDYALNEPYQYEYLRYFDESQRSYPVINLLPDFKATDEYPLVFRGDPHWNAAGNAFVAETLTKHVLQRQLLGAGSTPPRRAEGTR